VVQESGDGTGLMSFAEEGEPERTPYDLEIHGDNIQNWEGKIFQVMTMRWACAKTNKETKG